MNYLIGDAVVCAKEGGYKMFDGSVVKAPDSNSPVFDWIDDPVPLVTVIGDDAVTSGATLTGDNGCVVVSYKVPFLKPTFSVAFKKDGYYDSQITCEVTPEGADCGSAVMYRVPDTASIEGYVKDKVTKAGISEALVTLVNPEVLTADKVKSGVDKETGYAYVEVGYMPNVTYTWEARKYDENGNVVVSKVIKEGKGDPSYAKLTEGEIFNVLVSPFNSGEQPFDPAYLTGKWELHVKAEHEFTNTDQKLVEEAIGSFDIDVLITKLAEILSSNLNVGQEQVVLDEDGKQVSLPDGVKSVYIFGSLSSGFFYAKSTSTTDLTWETKILGSGKALDGTLICPIGTICNLDGSDPEYDYWAAVGGTSYIDIAGATLTYKKSLYPVGLQVKFLSANFDDLLKPDPACSEGSECYGRPFIQTGFMIRNVFKGVISTVDENLCNVTAEGEVVCPEDAEQNFTVQTLNYVWTQYNLNNKVEDFVDIPEISLVGPSVTAYMRQVITKDDGYYRINMIPPELSGNLEIFAKAEGYKFDTNTDIKLVNDLEAGKVSHYDLELEPITPPSPEPIMWDGWSYESDCSVDSVRWQVVENPESVVISDSNWSSYVWGISPLGLLPDIDNQTTGYLWFGSTSTGMFTDKAVINDTYTNTSSATVCGKAISPVIDLSNYSFPVLTFKSWFEVESVDVAKGQFDQMRVGFIIPSAENGGVSEVVTYNSKGDAVTLKTDTYYPIYYLNPDFEPDIQEGPVPYTTAGVNTFPVWKEFEVPVDGLAGYKVKFVFDFDSEDWLYNGFRGWGIDDIKVIDSMEDVILLPPTPPITIMPVIESKKVR
jgi:hypothetical protein